MVGDLLRRSIRSRASSSVLSLVRALAAHGAMFDDPRIRQALLREVGRGEDYFRSAVIEALGDYKALYAYDALVEVAKLDGPLQDDAALALGKIGDKRALETLASLQQTAPRQSQPTIAAAICLLGVNCGSHQNYLIETLKFATGNPQPRIPGTSARRGGRPRRSGRGRGARPGGRSPVRDRHSFADDSTRAPVSLALGTVALRNTPLMLSVLGKHPDRDRAIDLVAEGFDMLEEDLDKETFFAAARRAYWDVAGGIADAPVDADPDREAGLLMDYRQAGVDIDAGNETVRRIKSLARATFTPGVLSDIGSFGGLFRLDRDRFQDPVLVSSADGVGTKLKVAFMTGRHDTIGADLVNHCINDILVQGAEPLFFLDYLATGRLSPGRRRADRRRDRARVPGERVRVDRRRDRRDAGLLRRRRIRHRRASSSARSTGRRSSTAGRSCRATC